MEAPYGITTYCDDIRMEIGSKITLVGCYQAEMTVFGAAPLVLSAFCAFVVFRIPAEVTFNTVEIKLSIDLGGETKELASAEFLDSRVESEPTSRLIEAGQHFSLTLPIKLSPLVIEGDGFIRSRAYIDKVEYKLGSLKITISDPETMDPALNPFNPVKS